MLSNQHYNNAMKNFGFGQKTKSNLTMNMDKEPSVVIWSPWRKNDVMHTLSILTTSEVVSYTKWKENHHSDTSFIRKVTRIYTETVALRKIAKSTINIRKESPTILKIAIYQNNNVCQNINSQRSIPLSNLAVKPILCSIQTFKILKKFR